MLKKADEILTVLLKPTEGRAPSIENACNYVYTTGETKFFSAVDACLGKEYRNYSLLTIDRNLLEKFNVIFRDFEECLENAFLDHAEFCLMEVFHLLRN